MDLNQALIERAQHVIPGGVNSPVRAFGSVGGAPRFIERAKGPYMWDVTDKRFTDYVCSWGPMILGHNDPEVVEAVHAAVDRGLSFGAATRAEVEIAEMITNILPAMEEVRLVSSGTEAGMSAIRLARGYTGRNRIIKFEGCYHGHSDALLVKAGSGLLTFGNPSSAGVPASVTEHTMVLEYNNPEQLEDAFAKYGDEIACVIVEAFAGNMNLVRGTQEFIDTMRRLCTKHGALLIVDEVMTGFRVALKGAQSLFNVTPDITLSGNPVAVACGMATLKKIQAPGFYDRLGAQTKRLVEGLQAAAQAAGVPFTADSVGGMFGLYFLPQRPQGFADVMKADKNAFNTFFHGMLDRGHYFAPSTFEAGFVSITHTDEVIDKTIADAREVFASMAK